MTMGKFIKEESLNFHNFQISPKNNDLHKDIHKHEVVFAVNQDVGALERVLIDEISNPHSSRFRNYLTREEISQLTKSKSNANKVLEYLISLKSNDVQILRVSKYAEYIVASAPISSWESILSTKFDLLEGFSASENVIRTIRAPHYTLPQELTDYVSAIFHVSQLPSVNILNKKRSLVSNYNITKSHSQPFAESATVITPSKLNRFYNIPDNKPQGSRQMSQSVFETVGEHFSPSDLRKFQDLFHLPYDTVEKIVDISGSAASSDDEGYSRRRFSHKDNDVFCQYYPSQCFEANLDLQYLMSIAQNTPTTFWYVDETDDVFLAWILAVIDDENPPLVHSISFGCYEDAVAPSILQAFNIEAAKLSAMGVTIVVSSGDDGVGGYLVRYTNALCGYYPSFPASSPYVVSVGGTMGLESGFSERVCQSDSGGLITSGGGFSNSFEAPRWQKRTLRRYFDSFSASLSMSGYNVNGRGYPDVSLTAYNYPVVVGGNIYLVSGTSASAPVVAAMLSLINAELLAQKRPPVGFINPLLYYSDGSFANDVVNGDNHCAASNCCEEGFTAQPGWDPVTGFGSIDHSKLRSLLMSPREQIAGSALNSSVPSSHVPSAREALPSTENLRIRSTTTHRDQALSDTAQQVFVMVTFFLIVVVSASFAAYLTWALCTSRSRSAYQSIIESRKTSSCCSMSEEGEGSSSQTHKTRSHSHNNNNNNTPLKDNHVGVVPISWVSVTEQNPSPPTPAIPINDQGIYYSYQTLMLEK